MVCLNHEVVVSQLRKWTAPDLGSVANYTFYSNPTAPPAPTGFTDISIHPLYPTATTSLAFVVIAPLSCTRYPPPFHAQSSTHLDVARTCHPPDSAACLCASLHAPASSAMPHECAPTLCYPKPANKYLSYPGWFAHRRSLRTSVPLPRPP